MPHEWFGLSEPEFTATLNALIYTTSLLFALVCGLYALRNEDAESWLRRVMWFLVVFFVSLAAHRLWWNLGVWTDEPGDLSPYGPFFQAHRGWLVFPVSALVASSWAILWTIAHVSSRCAYCVVFSAVAVMVGSVTAAIWLTPAL